MQIIKYHQNYHFRFSIEFQAGHQYFFKKKCSHNFNFNSNPKYNIRN